MGRLFWKVFLGFWLTMAVIIVTTTIVLSLLVEQSEPDRSRARQEARLETSAITAQLLLNQGGTSALRDWLREHNARGRNSLWLLDERGRDLLGRRPPPLLRHAAQSDRRYAHRGVVAATITGPDGANFHLLTSPAIHGAPGRPGVLVIAVPIALIASGLVCWALAQYLVRPVHHLQRATRRLAAGELYVRVRPAIGRRRDEIADLGSDFDKMAERLQGLVDAQRQLLRDVSHELRTPLARLHVALGLARQRSQGVDVELDRIELEANRLDELIGELLTVMRLQSGADTPQFEPVDLQALVNDVVEDANLEAESGNRHLRLTSTSTAVVQGDPALLRRAIENIVRNAVRHTAENSAVEVGLHRNGKVRISIRDHGPGVAEADLQKLFKPFFRIENARDRASGGYGLGLTIAQQAIRVHGGEITASNAAGGGLHVEVVLPSSPPNNEMLTITST